MELTHILFIDDVLMMGEESLENMQSTSQILHFYNKATCMFINMDKSNLSLNNIPEELQ